MSLSTNMGDAAHLYDAIAYEILEEAGQPASKTAHFEVFLDHGPGPTSLGLYTAIEVTDDTVVKRFFGSDKGNIYEGDGPAMSLAAGERDKLAASFPKENNKDSDWSDLEKLYDALHATTRTTDPAAWRAGLEAVFDVDIYLEWLALAAVMQHWDTYGGMAHNIYLYNNPATKKLTWISWDHNLILGSSGPGGFPEADALAMPVAGRPGGIGSRSASLDKEDVSDNWPLIRFLMDDPTYYAAYVKHLGDAVQGPMSPAKMQARVDRYAAYLGPYALKQSDGGSAYTASVQSLTTAIQARVEAVNAFLATPGASRGYQANR